MCEWSRSSGGIELEPWFWPRRHHRWGVFDMDLAGDAATLTDLLTLLRQPRCVAGCVCGCVAVWLCVG